MPYFDFYQVNVCKLNILTLKDNFWILCGWNVIKIVAPKIVAKLNTEIIIDDSWKAIPKARDTNTVSEISLKKYRW